MNPQCNVGGQAVLEGVMMRSPNSFAIAVRRPSGEIAVREQRWISIWDKLKFLRWPFLRGAVVMFESLLNGMSALTFSANEAARGLDTAKPANDDAEPGAAKPEPAAADDEPLSQAALVATVIFSIAFGLALFVALPHALTWTIGWAAGHPLDVDSFLFHAVDGGIKLVIFVAYLWGISRLPDIKRVFMYHGAEHKSIFTYEQGQELTIANARTQTRIHPRCGTSFLVLVLLVSIFLFATVFPFVPKFFESTLANQALNVLMKIALMFPVAGLSYEFQKFSSRHLDNPLVRALAAPGMWLQHITTVEPTDDMLEVALVSLRLTLWRENRGRTEGDTAPLDVIRGLDELEQRLAA